MAKSDLTRAVLETEMTRRRARNSSLYRWLDEHHDELEPLLGASRAPWSATAETYNKAHPDERRVQRYEVMHVWARVSATRKKGAPARARPEISPKQANQPIPTASVSPVVVEPVIDPDDDREFTFINKR